ncbi:L-amino-acid oxidase [Plecturocebus cupreus]
MAITQGPHDVHVQIKTFSPSWNLKALRAVVVLLTVIGPVVQRITFLPPLPHHVQEALRGLHYVPATKVFLSFRRPYWCEEDIEGGHLNTDHPSRMIFYMLLCEGMLLLASYTWSEEALRLVLDDVAVLHRPFIHQLWDGTGVIKCWAEDPHSQGGFMVQPPALWQTEKDYGP